jgi:hypothetical protein
LNGWRVALQLPPVVSRAVVFEDELELQGTT